MANRRFNVVVMVGTTLLLINALFGASSFVSTPLTSAVPQRRAFKLNTQQPVSPETAPASGSGSLLASCSAGSLLLLAAGAIAMRRGLVTRYVNAPKKVKLESIPRPEKLLESPKFPLFQGSTDGYLARGTRERHAMTWAAPNARSFEMPTGGAAIMNKGDNLVYFRRKEHAIFLCKQLRKMKINDIKIYRIKKDGTVAFMHPLDGLWPENQTTGRPLVNWRPFPISGNPECGSIKWSKYNLKSFEADPLTVMFVKARAAAFADQETLFPIPNVATFVKEEDMDEHMRKITDAINQVPDLPKIPKN